MPRQKRIVRHSNERARRHPNRESIEAAAPPKPRYYFSQKPNKQPLGREADEDMRGRRVRARVPAKKPIFEAKMYD
ncbi:MAG: hypothetical protein D6714_02885 [Bacteroidetes bacterium]|nr:MAG: hypothetical protein D6714_02885 [Bacteroidota bacterium]